MTGVTCALSGGAFAQAGKKISLDVECHSLYIGNMNGGATMYSATIERDYETELRQAAKFLYPAMFTSATYNARAKALEGMSCRLVWNPRGAPYLL